MVMLPLALVSWWYTTAWKNLGRSIQRRIGRALDFFSVGLLLRTLFDPFRQIAAVKGRGNVNEQFHAWIDRSFSRFIGAFIRGTFVIVGSLVTFFISIVGLLQLIIWPLIPLTPLVALTGLMLGWTL